MRARQRWTIRFSKRIALKWLDLLRRQHLHSVEVYVPLRSLGAEDDGGLLTGGEGEDAEAVGTLLAVSGLALIYGDDFLAIAA